MQYALKSTTPSEIVASYDENPVSEITYETQARGDRDAYRRYLAGMDSSMRHKITDTITQPR
jgi:hypothetical protein